MENKKSLQSRWTEEKNAILLKAFKADESVVASIFGMTNDGLVDARGCTIPVSINGRKYVKIDFSYSVFESFGMITKSEFEDCLFESGKISDRNVVGIFSGCSFARANLSRSTIMGTYIRCNFLSSNMKKIFCTDAIFDGCNFSLADISGSSLYGSKFIKCDFSNSIVKNVNLTKAQFIDCVSPPQCG